MLLLPCSIRVDSVQNGGQKAETTELALLGKDSKPITNWARPVTRSGRWQPVNCPDTCGRNCPRFGRQPFSCQANGRSDQCGEKTTIDRGAYYEYALPPDVLPASVQVATCGTNLWSTTFPKKLVVMRQPYPDAAWETCGQFDTTDQISGKTDNMGSMIEGFVKPDKTGSYKFFDRRSAAFSPTACLGLRPP